MGVWSKIAGYGLMIGGGVGAAFTGGATLPLVAAGSAILQGDAKKEGVVKAAAQQQAAGDKAIGTLTAANQAAQQAYSPYTRAGAQAMGTLGGLMGFSSSPASTGMASSGIVPGASPVGIGGMAMPREGSQSPQAQAALQTASGYGGAGGGTLGGMAKGGLVRMRAPTGDMQWVSPQDVAHYQARGAEQVA